MLRRIEDFCGVFLSLSHISSDTVMLTMYGSMRGLRFGSVHWGDAHRGHLFCG